MRLQRQPQRPRRAVPRPRSTPNLASYLQDHYPSVPHSPLPQLGCLTSSSHLPSPAVARPGNRALPQQTCAPRVRTSPPWQSSVGTVVQVSQFGTLARTRPHRISTPRVHPRDRLRVPQPRVPRGARWTGCGNPRRGPPLHNAASIACAPRGLGHANRDRHAERSESERNFLNTHIHTRPAAGPPHAHVSAAHATTCACA